MKQLSLFDYHDLDAIRVTVSPDGRGHFIATIGGGWWMAYGDTVQGAVKNVMKRYEREA